MIRLRTCFMVICGVLLGLLFFARSRIEMQTLRGDLLRAQQRAREAQEESRHAHEAQEEMRQTYAAQAVRSVPPSATNAQATNAQLLDSQNIWEWSPLVKDMLQPYSVVTEEMLEAAVRTCFENGTMYCMRAQVVSGNLYITDYRAIFFDRWYAPARVMTLLDTLRWHNIPDIDIVVAAVDEPRIKMAINEVQWTKTVNLYPGRTSDPITGRSTLKLPPVLFSSTINRAHHDLPWPDFSFYTPRKEHKVSA